LEFLIGMVPVTLDYSFEGVRGGALYEHYSHHQPINRLIRAVDEVDATLSRLERLVVILPRSHDRGNQARLGDVAFGAVPLFLCEPSPTLSVDLD
jgi:hypothetical protein